MVNLLHVEKRTTPNNFDTSTEIPQETEVWEQQVYKDIVVCVNEAEGRDDTIRSAVQFANENNANLTGLYVRVSNLPPMAPYGLVADEIAEAGIKRQQLRAAKAQESFNLIRRELECNANWLELDESQHPLNAIVYSDLVISNQVDYDLDQSHSNRRFVNSLMLETGKPVKLIPKCWSEAEFGQNIVLGWDESREATRAIQDALALLQKAAHVEVVCVNYEDEDEAADISSFLSRRNVSKTFKLQSTNEQLDTPEKVLHNVAVKASADLIVVGGYGHARLRELFLGGATRYLTKHSNVPVLFSH